MARCPDANTGGLITALPNVDPPGPYAGPEHRMRTVAFSGDGSRIVAVGWDGAIRLWDAHSHQTLAVATPPYKSWSVAFSPDGRHIATGTGAYGGELQLWDANRLKPDGQPLIGHSGWLLYSVAFSPDGARIVSGSSDHSLRVWDIKTRRQVW